MFNHKKLKGSWKDWCWSWNSSTLATWWEELAHLKRPWCWERLRTGREGDDRGWYGWMASLTQWTWVWVNSGSWWWTRRPGMLQSMGSQRVGHDWETELNWLNHVPIIAWNCNYLFLFVWLLIVKTDKHLSLLWLCNYYSLNTIVSWLVNRKIMEFYITKLPFNRKSCNPSLKSRCISELS